MSYEVIERGSMLLLEDLCYASDWFGYSWYITVYALSKHGTQVICHHFQTNS